VIVERRLGLGVVGINPRIRRAILAGIAASSTGQLTGIVSRDAAKAAAASAEFGGSPYADLDGMLADPNVEVVVICTPHHLHHPMAIAALRAGRSVICEKPLALTTEDAEEMAQFATATGLPTAVNFTYHSLPGHRLVDRLLREGAIGTPRHLDLSYWQARQGLPGAAPSDVILDLGAHLLDVASWWSDDAGAGSISAMAGQVDRSTVSGARIWTALARTSTGTLVTLAANRLAAGWRNGMVGRVVGDTGCLTLTFDTDRVDVQLARFGDGAPEGVPRSQPIPADLAVGYREFPSFHVDRLVSALRGKIAFPDFAYGARIQQLIDASFRASQTTTWVDVAPSETG
jgi:predicted dehydrogenase